MATFEKRDIVEVIGEYVELTGPHGYDNSPYYKGLCPFHDDSNPSFMVFPNIQKFVCYTCYPERGDVIDFIRKFKNVDFETAKSIVTTELADEEVATRKMKAGVTDINVSNKLFSIRANNLFHLIDFETATAIMKSVDRALEQGHWRIASDILTEAGV